jgi:hypothetical protein
VLNPTFNKKFVLYKVGWFIPMVFKATFKNISVISWWSVLLVEENGAPGENFTT